MKDSALQRLVFDCPDKGGLAVVICHFNPCLFENPRRNLLRVLTWLAKVGLPTYAVELRCGASLAQDPVLPANHEKVLQLVSESLFFRKENLWDIAARRLPKSFRHVLCLDADVVIEGSGWLLRLMEALQSFKIVQPFSNAVWMDSNERAYRQKRSVLSAWSNGFPNSESGKIYHPGFAAAFHREFWSESPGLYNGILGEGASALMAAILGRQDCLREYFEGIAPALYQHYSDWSEAVASWVGTQFSAIEAEAHHFWHGATKSREYMWHSSSATPGFRLRKAWLGGFDPRSDLVTAPETGLLEWSSQAVSGKRDMILQVERYFQNRNEDEWFDSIAQ